MKIIKSEPSSLQKVDPMQARTKELNIKSQQTKKEFPISELEKLLGAR